MNQTNTNKEWFTVQYNGNKKKDIQRLCKDLKPIPKINIYSNYGKYLATSNFSVSTHPGIYQRILQNDLVIYGYCRQYQSQQRLFMIISDDIINTIFQFYTLPYPSIITMDGEVEINSYDGKYYIKPITHFPSVRSDIGIAKKQGKYYYKFQVTWPLTAKGNDLFGPLFPSGGIVPGGYDWNELHRHTLAQIGWCDDACEVSESGSTGIGDDKHSWAFDGGRGRKWHNGCQEYAYFNRWKLNDIIGCAIDVHKDVDTFDIGYYINGEYLGIAFENCKYDGNLYPAFSFQLDYAYGSFIFDPNHMRFMPDGYEPIY